jgi:hypothetical protein
LYRKQNDSEDLDAGERMIFKWVVMKLRMEATGFALIRRGTIAGLL